MALDIKFFFLPADCLHVKFCAALFFNNAHILITVLFVFLIQFLTVKILSVLVQNLLSFMLIKFIVVITESFIVFITVTLCNQASLRFSALPH